MRTTKYQNNVAVEMTSKTILITGASTGIGKATALHLDSLGFKVYAGVRKPADAQALKDEATEQLQPVFLDVDRYPINSHFRAFGCHPG